MLFIFLYIILCHKMFKSSVSISIYIFYKIPIHPKMILNLNTYFVSQKHENKNKHYDSNIRILGTDVKEINSDIYNIIDKMIPERKLIYEMEVKKLKNIISIEILKCVFRIKQVIEGKIFYDYVTVNLPNEDEEK